jgi:hypothetical protein
VVSSPFGWFRQFVGWNAETAVLADPATDHVGMEGIPEIVSELYIQYTYKGRLYCAIVRADEEVRLPRASAD